MASLFSPDHDACSLMKLLMAYGGRRNEGKWGVGSHIEWINLFTFLIAVALFTSAVNGHQYDSIGLPPEQSYRQAVSSPPYPQAFSVQLLARGPSSRRQLGGHFLPSSSPQPQPPSSSQAPLIGIIAGAIVGGIAVFALIGVAVAWKCRKKPFALIGVAGAWKCTKKPAAKDDEDKPSVCDGSETTVRSPGEDHAFLPVKQAAVAYMMEAHQEPAKAGNGVTGEETTFAAKESGIRRAASVAPGRTADRTALVASGARQFSHDEILRMTENFSVVIGEGGSSTVYYGQLQETGLKVAVKKLKDPVSHFADHLAELNILMRIRHKNLVSLVGLCEEQDEIILVSKYMASGSLFEVLKARTSELTWTKRLQIALEAATGLEYLHTGCKPAVIHRDIKSTNILLDENLEAKLADFGLSKAGAADGSECSAYQTKVAGTLGYIDPEYLYTQTLTKKSDVYSFGVVLFELITGKPAVVTSGTNEKLHLTIWVMASLVRGEIESVLDPMLKGNCNIESVWAVAGIARTATQQGRERPDMPEIVSTLKAALRMETSWVDMASASDLISSVPSFREDPHNPAAR